MDIELTLVDKGAGQVEAEATVVKDDLTPKTGVTVALRVNGRAVGSCQVNDQGVATKQLKLRVGELARVTASVVGLSHLIATDDVTPEAKKRREATATELIISCLFIAVVATASYMSGQIGVFLLGLLGAMVIMFRQTRADGGDVEEFVGRLQNNDWIFHTMRGIAIFGFLMFLLGLWVDPPELNPIKAIGNQLKDMVSTKLKDPWANERWFSFTGFFDGWGRTALFFLFWTAVSYPVSFWDDWVAKRKEAAKTGDKGGIGEYC